MSGRLATSHNLLPLPRQYARKVFHRGYGMVVDVQTSVSRTFICLLQIDGFLPGRALLYPQTFTKIYDFEALSPANVL